MSILEILAQRFTREDDHLNDTTFLTRLEFAQLLNLFQDSTKAHNELVKFVIETLTYKLGVEFDNLKLERQNYPYFNKDTDKQEIITPLVLILIKNVKPVLIMEGGETGIIIHDLTLLFDKLLTMNTIQFSGRPMLDFSLLVNVGIEC